MTTQVANTRKGILHRSLEKPLTAGRDHEANDRVKSPKSMRIREKQKMVLRQFRRLSPVCDALREKFHSSKVMQQNDADLFRSTEDTNFLFGEGHTYSDNKSYLVYKRPNHHNQCDINRAFQLRNFQPFSEMEGNWHLYQESEPFFRPYTQLSNWSTRLSSRAHSRRSSMGSRIQSTTDRMKSNRVKNKVAHSVSKYLNDETAQLQNGPRDHLEKFLDAIPAEVDVQTTVETNVGAERPVEPKPQISDNAPIFTSPLEIPKMIVKSVDSDRQHVGGQTQKLLRRPMRGENRNPLMPSFELTKFRPAPIGSDVKGKTSSEEKFPITVRELTLVPDEMKETAITKIMKLPAIQNAVQVA